MSHLCMYVCQLMLNIQKLILFTTMLNNKHANVRVRIILVVNNSGEKEEDYVPG